jgi:phosphate transport system substrate-binding protein
VANQIQEDLRTPITNPPGADAYPISTFTYMVLDKDQKNRTKAKLLVDSLWCAVREGQKLAPALSYAPLPSIIVELAEGQIKAVTYRGQRVRVEKPD